MDISISENQEKKRFETQVENKWAFIEYIRTQEKMYLTHTEVPTSLEGNGIGSTLVKHALKHIEKESLKLVPLCPFVAGYIKRHPEYKELLAEGYTIKEEDPTN
ncbi:GNAT family N-acetyltransferase [Marinirhabdus gelatinilytica]|uniref:N-acetyltransferase domain-containing protein n=1 Tax=Marinirhabdus gelatinilytica TaxID=1703343 RepID=A0A370Q8G4_9FLAO|nr:GNAT family N-acetyltransferase [Marinirhabdus gelatinilytica]RDK84662.1 hypothetical protein C8D94_10434 [Marinirhabdus gelatinilytica]